MCFLQLKCRFPGSRGVFSIWEGSPSGGSPSGGVLHLGGFSIQGGVFHPGGFSICGGWGPPSWGVLHLGGSPSREVCSWGGVCSWGSVPCDLSHHAFDVTCMLPPHQLRHTNCAPAYILPGHVTCNASWDTHPPLWTDKHLSKHNLRKLRLRAVKSQVCF